MINSCAAFLWQGFYCGAMGIESATQAELRNNLVAHNIAGISGGGLRCAEFYGKVHQLHLVNNTWLNNTSKAHGGGVVLQPCNATVHGDQYLGNNADEEGAGFMVHGGSRVRLQRVQVACNTAPQAAGMLVKISDLGKPSTPVIMCSNITANGGAAHSAARAACLNSLASKVSQRHDIMSALTADAESRRGQITERGGGMLVAAGQNVTLLGCFVTHNQASSAGAGLYVDGGKVTLSSPKGLPSSLVTDNSCPEGLGGGAHLAAGGVLLATNTTWSNNQAMYGGAVFATGVRSRLELLSTSMANSSAVGGGAIATLGGSNVTCVDACDFTYNTAKVGGQKIGAQALHAAQPLPAIAHQLLLTPLQLALSIIEGSVPGNSTASVGVCFWGSLCSHSVLHLAGLLQLNTLNVQALQGMHPIMQVPT